ncbi:MAG: outer membrane protein [Mesorhizobium sp.]
MKNINLSRTAVAAAALFALSAPVFAADAVEMAPEPAPYEAPVEMQSGWAGGYIGAYGSWTKGETRAPGIPSRTKPDGIGVGGFAGWQGQSGNIVYGAEADAGYNGAGGGNGVIASTTKGEGSLRARLGYAPNDRVLVYGTAGGALANVTVQDGGKDSNTELGYTVGAGVDAKITDNVFGRVEYRYTDLGSGNYNLAGGATKVDHTSNRINLGVGLKF